MNPTPKSSTPSVSFGFGFVATRCHMKLISIAPPHASARTLSGIPQRPSENGTSRRSKNPRRRACRIARLASR